MNTLAWLSVNLKKEIKSTYINAYTLFISKLFEWT